MRVVPCLVICLTACVGSNQTKPPEPLPAWEDRVEELSRLPEPHLKKVWPSGSVVAVEAGEKAPWPGILLSEDRADDAARLRIAYDELFVVAQSNQRLYVLTAKVADQNLKRADEEIARLNEALKAREPTWWDQNGSVVAFGAGVLAAGLFTVGVLAATNAVSQ